jgi:hypothetical protein
MKSEDQMLTKTFCHIDGITINTEMALWSKGISDWDSFLLQHNKIDFLPRSKVARILDALPASREALSRRDMAYFKQGLPGKEHWRLVDLGPIAYVDIETTGISRYDNDITLIGIYDGTTTYSYIRGDNLPQAHAKLQEFDILVTFNGKQFDLPFIESHFGCTYSAAHLDLRYMLREIGLQGGLKSIERQLGIDRGDDLAGVDGFEAVRLWQRHCRGDLTALAKLVKYNREDVVNLKALLTHYLSAKRHRLPSGLSL